VRKQNPNMQHSADRAITQLREELTGSGKQKM